jgi:hypothetical protein
MSVGKLTLLSADCDGSGAVVGSSAMVADSSGAEGAGCVGAVDGGAAAAAAAGASAPRGAAGAGAGLAWALAARLVVDTEAPVSTGGALACSAARSVTSAAPKRAMALRVISQIDRLFGIAHHSKTYCCTGAVRAVTPGQSQIRCTGGLPIGTAYDMASAVFGAQWIGDGR